VQRLEPVGLALGVLIVLTTLSILLGPPLG